MSAPAAPVPTLDPETVKDRQRLRTALVRILKIPQPECVGANPTNSIASALKREGIDGFYDEFAQLTVEDIEKL
jgi:hypothetical protein